MTPFRTHSTTVVLSLKHSSEDRALSRHDNLSADVSEVKQEGLETVPRFPGQFHLRKSENWHKTRNIRGVFGADFERFVSSSSSYDADQS